MFQRPVLLCLILAYGMLHTTGLVLATEVALEAPAVQQAAAPSCVEVEVDGEKAPSYACLSQRLLPTASAARPATEQGLVSESIAQRPSNQLGVFNRAAAANRMGNTFGTSVYPQRPPAAMPAQPVLPVMPRTP